MTGQVPPRYPTVNWRNAQAKGLIAWWPNFNSNSITLSEATRLTNDMAALSSGSLSWRMSPKWFPPAHAGTWGFRATFTPPADAAPWTLSVWSTRPASGDFNYTLNWGNEAAGKNPAIVWYNASTFVRFAIYGANVDVAISSFIAVGDLAHLVMTYDGTNIYVYINGKYQGSTAGSYLQGTSFAYIGRSPGGTASIAPTWDARIYNRCLRQDEIVDIYRDPSKLWTRRRSRAKAPAVVGGSFVGDGLTRSALLNRRRLAA